MHFEGTVTINAPQEKVWEFMTDPDTVSECVPGLKSVEVIEPGRKFRAISNLAIGKVRMPFTNVIEWVELDAPSRALMKIHSETSSSVVDIKGELILSGNADDTTDLNWSAEVVVMGTIASLASRLMGSTTKKLSNEFFECAKNKIEV